MAVPHCGAGCTRLQQRLVPRLNHQCLRHILGMAATVIVKSHLKLHCRGCPIWLWNAVSKPTRSGRPCSDSKRSPVRLTGRLHCRRLCGRSYAQGPSYTEAGFAAFLLTGSWCCYTDISSARPGQYASKPHEVQTTMLLQLQK